MIVLAVTNNISQKKLRQSGLGLGPFSSGSGQTSRNSTHFYLGKTPELRHVMGFIKYTGPGSKVPQ